jgi:hypothetical protein
MKDKLSRMSRVDFTIEVGQSGSRICRGGTSARVGQRAHFIALGHGTYASSPAPARSQDRRRQ